MKKLNRSLFFKNSATLFLFIIVMINPDYIKGQGFFVIDGYDVTEFEAFQQTWDFVVDTNNTLYVGHGGGILRYDGEEWITRHGKESHHILRLVISNSGTIFYGSESEFGYLKPDSINRFQFVELSEQTIDSSSVIGDIYDIHEFNNKIYFTSQTGFFVWDYSRLTFVPANFKINRSFLVDDKIYVQEVNGGVYSYSGTSFSFIEGSQIFINDYVYGILRIQDSIFFASRKKGFFKSNGREFDTQFQSIATELLDSKPFRMIYLGDDKLSIATLNRGLFLIDTNSNSVKNYIHDQNLKGFNQIRNNMILGLAMDHQSGLWIASIDGINRIDTDIPISVFDNISGIEEGATSIVSHEGEIYIGTQNGLFKTIKYSREIKFVKILDHHIFSLKQYSDGILATSNKGLFSISSKGNEQLTSETVRTVEKIDNKLFFNTGNGLSFLEIVESGKIIDTKLEGAIKELVYKDDVLWILDTHLGLRKFDPIELKEIDFNNFLPHSNQIDYLGILFDTLRIGTSKGLFKYQNDSNSIVQDKSFSDELIFNEQVLRFHEINIDTVWFWNDRRMRLFIRQEGGWDILESPYNFLLGDPPPVASLKDSSGFWLVNPKNVKKFSTLDWEYKTNFKTNITGIYVNNDSLIYGGFGEPVKDIVLPYRDNELRFTYAAASYIDPEKNTYSVKLDGFDDDWSDWSLETQKDYTNIPEGNYEFRVRSKNVYKVDGKEDIIYFSVLPPWYRTWWAYLIYLILISSFLYTAFRIRVNQILKVERMRSKIAGDLHDEVSATLTGISYFAEAIKRDPDQSKKDYFVSLITESADDAKEKITDIVWSINPDNDNWELFLSKCRRYASDLLESKGIDYELKITEHIPGKFNMEVRQQLWMIFKEILTNSVRHSEAKRLDVIMDVDGKNLKLIIQDDGKGFDLKTIDYGNGIESIKSRASSINAFIDVNTSPEFGTRWRMVLPL